MLVLKNFWKGAHKIQEGYTQNMQKQKPLCSSLKFFICFQSLDSISVINRGITFIKLAPSMLSKGSKLLKEQITFRLIPSSPLVPTSLTSKSFHLYWCAPEINLAFQLYVSFSNTRHWGWNLKQTIQYTSFQRVHILPAELNQHDFISNLHRFCNSSGNDPECPQWIERKAMPFFFQH